MQASIFSRHVIDDLCPHTHHQAQALTSLRPFTYFYYTLSLWHKNETIFYDRRKNDPINGALHLCTFFSFSKVLILFFPMASLNFIHGSVCHFRNKIMFSWLQVWSQESSVYILISTKGQLISIFLFGVSNFFQKTNKNTLHSSKNKLFLEEFSAWQFAFEINWALV